MIGYIYILMTNSKLLQKILSIDKSIISRIIKPKQFEILKKQFHGEKLTDNEKRYLRGNLRKKIECLEQLWDEINGINEYQQLLNIIDSYYITGLEALRYHGFGWYYLPKIIEVINTRLEGKIKVKNKTLRFYRVRSISNSDFIIDNSTGLKYATNKQIIVDTRYTKNEYTKLIWKNMLNRYWDYFVENPKDYKRYHVKKVTIDESLFGV